MKEELLHEDLTHRVIGAAMAVLNVLKPGLDEGLYENASVIELKEKGLAVDQQRQFQVRYKGQSIGLLIPDLIVNDALIVDPKVVTSLAEAHTAQMLGYLAITELKVALLLNFKDAQLQWKRVVRQKY